MPARSCSDLPNVCVIISTFSPLVGGAERATERLCRSLQERGMGVLVLTRRHPGLRPQESIGGIPVRRLGHPSTRKLGALSFALHTLWLLSTKLKDYRILHVQNPDTPLLVGLIARVALRRKLLVTMHGTPAFLFSRASRERRFRFRLMGRLADAVGVLSPAMADQVAEAGLPAERIRLLPNGVDLSIFTPPTADERRSARRQLGLDDSMTVYLFVGRLVSLKKVDLLLEAWSTREAESRGTLLVVGDGEERSALEALAADLELADVRFEGTTEDVVPYLHAADVFVLPSSVEALSCALLEAMATGLAVLVADLPGNTAVVRQGENGLAFAQDDCLALCRGLDALRSPSLRREVGDRAAAMIQAKFSLESITDLHADLYRELSQTRVA